MNEKGKRSENERRDWVIILVILLFGFMCVLLAGERAIRLAPNWKLDTNMRSNLDPNSDFLTNRPANYYEPLDPSILTQPSWFNVFLTPGAIIETRTPSSPSNATNTPIATNTLVPTVNSPTATVINPVTNTATSTFPSPTNTLIYYPPPSKTSTPKPPPPPTNTPVSPPTTIPVDLGITKTDGATTYIAGSTVTYTIVVTNYSTNGVTGAMINDAKPVQVATWGWCAGTCTPTVFDTTDINITFNIGGSASTTYTIQANIDTDATGDLSNTAIVSVPSGYTDTNMANNSFTDTNTLVVLDADIAVTKTSPTSTYTPGSTVTYTVTISNNGPDNANGVRLVDTKPAMIDTWTWTCVENGGATGCSPVADSNADFIDIVNLPNGDSITYTVIATISGAATGDLLNTATRILPPSINDPIPGNDTASYTHTRTVPSIDLSIFKDDGSPTYSPGDVITYTIIVSNPLASGATASGFNITDNLPVFLPTSLSVSCAPSSGSDSCGTNGTTGTNIVYNGARLSPGQTLTVTINMGVSLWQTGTLSNTANIVIPGGANFTDPNLGNNSSTDINNATQPICDATIDVSGTGSFAITDGNVTCLRFTDPTLTQGAMISISNVGTTYLRWTGLPEGGSGACNIEQGLLWIFDNNLNGIYIDRNTDINLYAQADFGNDTLTISSIADWPTGCP